MILEEIVGGVVSTIIRENGDTYELAIGDYFSDHERATLTVVGTGKIVIRVDQNCTVEVRGEEVVVEEVAPAEVPAAATPVAEAPVIVQPVKAPKE